MKSGMRRLYCVIFEQLIRQSQYTSILALAVTEELVSKLDSTGEVGKLKRYTLRCIVGCISFRIHHYKHRTII